MPLLGISRIIYFCVGGKLKKIELNQFLPKRQISPFHKENNKVNFFHLTRNLRWNSLLNLLTTVMRFQ